MNWLSGNIAGPRLFRGLFGSLYFKYIAGELLVACQTLRWSRFVRQAAKVDLMTKRMIHHEDTQTVHG